MVLVKTAEYDLQSLTQRADWEMTLVLKNDDDTLIPLDGYSGKMQIRICYNSAVISELSTDNGKIVINTVDSEITLKLPNTETAVFDFSSAVYDLQLTDNLAEITYLIKGKVPLQRTVTE